MSLFLSYLSQPLPPAYHLSATPPQSGGKSDYSVALTDADTDTHTSSLEGFFRMIISSLPETE